MNGRSALIVAAWLACLASLGAGCGPAKQVQPALVFHPPPPDPPRLQYLATINDAAEWQPRQRGSFADFIAGPPKNLENPGEIRNPFGIAARDGKIYVTDLGRFRIHIIDVARKTYSTLGTGDQVVRPAGITIDADGTKYVADSGKKQVTVFGPDDRYLRTLGDPEKCAPIAVGVSGDELFVADALGGKVQVWTRDGTLKRIISSKGIGPDQLMGPSGLAIGPQGHVFVTDMELSIVKEFDPGGRYIRSIGGPGDRPGYFARPKGIAIDPEGRIYIADAQWDKIQIFSPEGQLLLCFGESTRQPHGMVTPTGLAIDATSLEAFRQYVSKDFEAEYLVLVANEFGINKITVHAFGRARPRAAPAAAEASPPALAGLRPPWPARKPG